MRQQAAALKEGLKGSSGRCSPALCACCQEHSHLAASHAVWARLGAEVTVVEFLDRIVPSMVGRQGAAPAG